MHIGTAGSIRTSMGSPKSPAISDINNIMMTPRATTELVGEIDTRAPFQSVKAAVTIFGEGTTNSNSSPQLFTPKIKRQTNISDERVLEKETQMLLALKEVQNYKQHLKSAETSKTQVTRELQKANTTLHELQQMLDAVNQSRQTTIEATQLSNNMARHLKQYGVTHDDHDHNHNHGGPANFKHILDNVRENYKLSSADLIAAKQELTKIKQDFDVASLKKLAAFKQMTDAQQQKEANFQRLKKLTHEVETVKESLNQVKLASLQTREEHARAVLEKESKLNYLKQTKKEKDRKLLALREETTQEEEEDLKAALRETTQGIVVLQEQLKNAGQTDLESLRMKKLLQGLEEEEHSIRSLVKSLKAELEGLVQENSKLNTKAEESESIADSMKAELERTKAQLVEEVVAQQDQDKETKLEGEDCYSLEAHSNIQRLLQEAENARQEAEETIRNAKELNQEAESGRNYVAKEMEEKLQLAVQEAILAKAAEKLVGDRIHEASSPKSEAHSKKPDMIRISANEFRSLREKAEEFKRMSAEKVANAMADVEASKSTERVTTLKREAGLKEIQETKDMIEDALKKEEEDTGAKKVIESELQKTQREKGRHKKTHEYLGESSHQIHQHSF